ncbi:hypothetical protein OIU84_022886 [Salix udensis]|uniref:Uncharacterized protein n=1 Tax=Salix udensis TaxID=889485 RepID=A0AAD6PF07_9ROSI|nr:hypothetical protein OIU84_022886 [Salix udensis]KAJ6427379.1 hypothetical protein OIU84_022886 [Salix udensis]
MWRSSPSWLAVSANRHPSAVHFMSNQQSLGLQLAQLSRDASAAGAARRLTTQRKNVLEIESVGAAGKSDSNRVKKYFRMEVKICFQQRFGWLLIVTLALEFSTVNVKLNFLWLNFST